LKKQPKPVSWRLWFNLELAKKPVQCVEYIVAHLLECNHTERFTREGRTKRGRVWVSIQLS
jgi:predicted metal-dependent hydrolase